MIDTAEQRFIDDKCGMSSADVVKEPRRRGCDEMWGYGIVLFFSALYFLSFFNRFAGLRSGDGEFSGGMLLLAGRLPYRDYFTAGPPLNQIKAAIELTLFGKALIVSRACGVAERMAIAALLYGWLRRSFSAWGSAIAALATIIISAGDISDPLASYNHDAIFLAMLCGFAASLSLETEGRRSWWILAAMAGVAAGLSSLTKQTVGLGTTAAVLVMGSVAYARISGVRRGAAWILIYLTGFAIPVLAVASYLSHLGVLAACLQMLFVTGPRAKASGGAAVFLTRELALAQFYILWTSLGIAALVLTGRAIGQSIRSGPWPEEQVTPRWRWLAAISLAMIGGGELLALFALPVPQNITKAAVYFTFIGTGVFGVYAADCALRVRSSAGVRLWQIALLAAVGWSVAFTLSLSWPCFEAMAVPGLGLLLAAAVDGARRRIRWVVYGTVAVLVFVAVLEKLDLPFSFDGQTEPAVRLARARSQLPELRGMRLPPEVVRLLDTTVPLMHAAAVVHKPVFTYPEFGLLYALSGGEPPTSAWSHNIDVVSDSLARADAVRLQKNPPEVILYNDASLKGLELLWRNGNPSGQRDIMAAVDKLTTNCRAVDTFRLLPEDTPWRLYAGLNKCGASSAIARTGRTQVN